MDWRDIMYWETEKLNIGHNLLALKQIREFSVEIEPLLGLDIYASYPTKRKTCLVP